MNHHGPPSGGSPQAGRPGPLLRPVQGRVLLGVCAGLASRFGGEAVMLRGVLGIACLITLVLPGAIVYCVLALLMPEADRAPATVARRWERSRRDRRAAGVCGGLAAWLGWDATQLRLAAAVLSLVTAGAVPVAYLVAWAALPEEPPGSAAR